MPRRDLFILTLILLIALLLRAHQIGKHSLWLDEILTVKLSSGRGYAHLDLPQNQLVESPVDWFDLRQAPPLWHIWSNLDRDVHPPLFYLILRGWREVFGDGDVAIRMLSVILSLVAIVMLYVAAQPLSGRTTALWACTLMALAGPQIEYAQENRSYMLLLVTLLGAAAAIVRMEEYGASFPRAIALTIAVLAALLTHYLAIPALAALLAYVLLRLRRRPLKLVLLSFAAAGLLFALTWGPLWLEQMRGFGARIQFTADTEQSFFETVRLVCELPLRFFTQSAIRPAWIGMGAVLLYVVPLLILKRRRDLLLWWMWFVGYVAIMTASELIRGGHALASIRYTLAASPAAFVLAAGLLADARSWRAHIVPAVLSIACIAALPAAYVRSKANWRELARFFESQVSQDDVIVVHSGDQDDWRARCMYVCLRYYARRPTLPVVMLAEADPQVLRQIAGRDIWLLRPPHVIEHEPLLPGWSVIDMAAEPLAGTLTRLQFDTSGE